MMAPGSRTVSARSRLRTNASWRMSSASSTYPTHRSRKVRKRRWFSTSTASTSGGVAGVAGVVIPAIYASPVRGLPRGRGPMSPSQFRQSAHPQLQGCAQSHSWPAQVQLSAAGFSRVDMFRLLFGGVRERLSYLLTDEAMDHYTLRAGFDASAATQQGECLPAKAANVVVSPSRVARARSAGNTAPGLGIPPHENGCRSFQVAIVSRET